MKYPVYFSASGVPVAGLTPVFLSLFNVETLAAVTPPAITEIGGGWYVFELTPVDALVGVIDSGSYEGVIEADRYKSVSIPVSAASAFGSAEATITLNDPINSLPIPDVEVVVLNEDESLLVNSGLSNSMGVLVAQLNPGEYVVRLRKDGYNFATPQSLTVAGTTAVTYNGTPVGDVAADFRSIVVPRSPNYPVGV